MFPATDLAIPLPVNAVPAKLDAWLKRSQRENAIVLVIMRTSASAVEMQVASVIVQYTQMIEGGKGAVVMLLSPASPVGSWISQRQRGHQVPSPITRLGK